MKIFENLKKMFISFENEITKEHSCISCSREILDGTEFQICEDCFKNLNLISDFVCDKCGEVLVENSMCCEQCKSFNYSFDKNKSICHYTDVPAKIVKSLKYGGRKYYAKHIAELMTVDKSFFEEFDLITFVPMGKKRLRARGFNQAEEIAKEISKLVNIPFESLLIKIVENKNQAKLSQKERLENLKGTFEIDLEKEDKIKGKKILIVDDVFTTGATLSECAKVLKSQKPKKVCSITFAKTRFNSIN